MNYVQRTMIAAYTDYVNNYITTERFADVNGITKEAARVMIECGSLLREDELRFFGQTCGADNFREYLRGPLERASEEKLTVIKPRVMLSSTMEN